MRIVAFRPVAAVPPAPVAAGPGAAEPGPAVGFLLSDGPGDPGCVVPLTALADAHLGPAALDPATAALDR